MAKIIPSRLRSKMGLGASRILSLKKPKTKSAGEMYSQLVKKQAMEKFKAAPKPSFKAKSRFGLPKK